MEEDYVYKKIDSIIFGLIGPEQIKDMSVAKVVTPELYDKEGYPVDGGLMDIRLGVIDPGLRCKTCGGKLKECTGHFGYVELARPVIHIKYVRTIFNLLRSTCRVCGKILMDDKKIEKYTEIFARLTKEKDYDEKRVMAKEVIASLKNIRKCPHCREKQNSIKLEKPMTFIDNDKKLSPLDVRSRLENIREADLEFLGVDVRYSKPSSMILTILPIPPVTMRPSITLESGERSEDDLTHKLGDIVRINQRLFENINAGAPEIIVEDLWELLQYHITTYFDNSVTQIPPARHRSGQLLKTLSERIKSKEGRFRHNLAGKRVNFAARTVISPDPKIGFNEVGIPQEIAFELTIPEKVTEWNLEKLKELIKRGPKVYPGANYVVREDGSKKKISDETTEQLLEELKVGDRVERHLVDGDISIFNRQPSLHRMSIMCHKIRVFPGKSFRLNPSVCFPYNADFDGDEMNLHIPQTEEARSEAETLMQVQTQIMTPKHGYNVIGCVEDAVTGNYLLTKGEGMQFTKHEAGALLLSIGVDDVEFKKEKIDGRDLFSSLLPKDFNYTGFSKGSVDDEASIKMKQPNNFYVFIKNGQLLSGVIDDNSIGEGNGRLLRDVYRKYGEDYTLDFIGKVFRLGIAILLRRGFTTTLGDTDLPQNITDQVKELVADAEKSVYRYIDQFDKKELEALPGKTIKETLEVKILEVLNKIRNKIGNLVADNSKEDNPTIIMAKSGAKGNLLNLAQMAAGVGQQALRGKRIEHGYRGRTLSLFKKDNLGPEAHGFVKNSFKSGLTPVEFFFHAMTGRDALMDTALRTPKSGYLYRRLANALQDLKVEYDHTVRDANKGIVQFKYGEDGIDVSKSEGGTLSVSKVIKEVVKE